MKKLIIAFALMLGCMAAANAQLLQVQQSPLSSPVVPRAAKAPMQKVLGPNQLYMGPYFTDELTDAGL